MHGVCIVFEF